MNKKKLLLIGGILPVLALLLIIYQIFWRGNTMDDLHREKGKQANRLVKEKSPYLLQHAYNPVDWYPWGEEAFEKARRENKLIFLSIGYSACHWCHVMAHESFENDSIAAFMNENFVNIKVDREEYPDVDHLYQTFVQMTTGRGGWPLSVFLTPDLVPIYGGTYFPAQPRYGMISFTELLKRILDVYRTDPEKVEKSAADVKEMLRSLDQVTVSDELPDAPRTFRTLFQHLQQVFDNKYGGFSQAPKFPHVADLDFLLNYYHHSGEVEARMMVLFTLQKMAEGGIYDQIGGGFHRYSTDAFWLVPHFEKMLYDNALLIPLYADAFRLTGEEFFRRIARETADFVLRELRDEKGGFYSTLDADSEGEEGKYYLWAYEEVQEILGSEVAEMFCDVYGITPQGNFEGKNILHREQPLDVLARKYRVSVVELQKRLNAARQKLLQERHSRVRPGLDDKILSDWNGMMITALWHVYQITGDLKYRKAAETGLSFLRQNRLSEGNRLFHSVRGKEEIAGYLDDYAYVIQALIDGFETTQKTDYLQLAVELSEYVLDHFWDEKKGGFYFTESKTSTPLVRLRQPYDASIPSGNSIMALNLLRLHTYTGNERFAQPAEGIFKIYRSEMENRGYALSSLVRALVYYSFGPLEITISVPEAKKGAEIQTVLGRYFAPNRVVVSLPSENVHPLVNPELVKNRWISGKTAIFICYQRTCSLTIFDLSEVGGVIQNFGLYLK